MTKASKILIANAGVVLATWFGLGYLRPAPGTWGSIGALPPALLIVWFSSVSGLAIATVLVFVIGIWATRRFHEEHSHGGNDDPDHKEIVIDEVAGMWLALLPAGLNVWLWVMAFILFRILDITKPWPIGWVDRQTKSPLGVMMDDILAGAITALIITGVIYAGFS